MAFMLDMMLSRHGFVKVRFLETRGERGTGDGLFQATCHLRGNGALMAARYLLP